MLYSLPSIFFVYLISLPLLFGWLFVLGLYKQAYLQMFKYVYFLLYICWGELALEGFAHGPVNYTILGLGI